MLKNQCIMNGFIYTVYSYGICGCGCGGKTTPQKIFKHGHHSKIKGIIPHVSGENHPRWNGGRTTSQGYPFIRRLDHPRSNPMGYIKEHILVAEKTLGKPLPKNVVIHHVNEEKHNPYKIVICENENYHRLLHKRMRAFIVCGHANWLKCKYCKQYDDPVKMYVNGKDSFHLPCAKEYREKNKDRINEAKRKYRKRVMDKIREEVE